MLHPLLLLLSGLRAELIRQVGVQIVEVLGLLFDAMPSSHHRADRIRGLEAGRTSLPGRYRRGGKSVLGCCSFLQFFLCPRSCQSEDFEVFLVGKVYCLIQFRVEGLRFESGKSHLRLAFQFGRGRLNLMHRKLLNKFTTPLIIYYGEPIIYP